LIWPTFIEESKEESVELLNKFLKDSDSPIDKEKYLEVQRQLGKEPDPDKIPLGFDDLTPDCQIAINIYNRLGNRVYGEVGFTGKDFTNLPILIEAHNIVNKLYLLDLLNCLDNFYLKKNAKQIKKMIDDMKKKK